MPFSTVPVCMSLWQTVTKKSIRGSKTWMKLIIPMGGKRYGQEEWKKSNNKNAILFNGTTEISGLDKMQNFIWFPRCNQNMVNLNVICTINVMYALRHLSVLIAAGSWKISAHPLVIFGKWFWRRKKKKMRILKSVKCEKRKQHWHNELNTMAHSYQFHLGLC